MVGTWLSGQLLRTFEGLKASHLVRLVRVYDLRWDEIEVEKKNIDYK